MRVNIIIVALYLCYAFTDAVTRKHPRPLSVFASALALLAFADLVSTL